MTSAEPRFALSERELSLRDAAEAMARAQPRANDAPLTRDELLAIFAKLRPLGYLASTLPSDRSAGPLGFAALVEGLSPPLALLGNHSVQRYLHAYGTEAQKRRFLEPLLEATSIAAIAITEPQAGADLARIEMLAKRSGRQFVLTGQKTWVTHGLTADVFIVLAQTDVGPTRFIVPGDVPGLDRSALNVVGLKHLTFAQLQFRECRVDDDLILGEPGKGRAGARTAFPIARALAALQSVRIGETALELACKYVHSRELFGQSLARSPLAQDRLAHHAATLAGARFLAYSTIAGLNDHDCAAIASQAKALACQGAVDACLWTLELMGSAALEPDTSVEPLLRDARMMAVVDGTAVLNRFVAARRLLRS